MEPLYSPLSNPTVKIKSIVYSSMVLFLRNNTAGFLRNSIDPIVFMYWWRLYDDSILYKSAIPGNWIYLQHNVMQTDIYKKLSFRQNTTLHPIVFWSQSMRIEFFVKWSFGRGGYNSAKLKRRLVLLQQPFCVAMEA